jgi:hypothetical protein
MKRLLLSTALILGTLTGVKGSGDLTTTDPVIDPQISKMLETVSQLATGVADLRTHVTTTSAQLERNVATLQESLTTVQTAQSAMNTTLQQLLPAIPAGDLPTFTALQTACTSLERSPPSFDETMITQLKNYLSSLHPNSLDRIKKRIAVAELAIEEYFNQIIDHKEWTKNQLLTAQNIVIFVAFAILNLWTFIQFFFTEWKFYPSLPPMTGGVTIMTLNNLVNANVTKSQSSQLSRIQATWKVKLSNPAVKSYISSLLGLEFLHKNSDILPKGIQRKLEAVMSTKSSFADLLP